MGQPIDETIDFIALGLTPVNNNPKEDSSDKYDDF
jgi:hypothetical protein